MRRCFPLSGGKLGVPPFQTRKILWPSPRLAARVFGWLNFQPFKINGLGPYFRCKKYVEQAAGLWKRVHLIRFTSSYQ